jgi:cytochrome b561
MAARPKRYPFSLAVLHWAMALIIAAQLGLGFQITGSKDAVLSPAGYWHVQMGAMIFVTAVLRLGLRLTRPMPSQPGGWRGLGWKLEYWTLYALMLLTPLTGLAAYAHVTGGPVPVFGVVEMAVAPMGGLHRYLAAATLALLWAHTYLAVLRFLTVGPPYLNRIIPSLAPDAPRESA